MISSSKKQQTLLQATLKLPKNFQQGAVLAFYQRDKETIAERVTERCIEKGMLWEGYPACLSISFTKQQAKIQLLVDGGVDKDATLLVSMVQRMLGLTQNAELFEAQFKEHPVIGELITKHSGLRVPLTATAFEALVWAITGQQISVSAAVSIRRRFIQLLNIQHSNGLLCHPDAKAILTVAEDQLGSAGLSKTKAKVIRLLAQQVVDGDLPLQAWELSEEVQAQEISEKLLALSGIGPWTVSYALLRGFGWLDGSLHGDVAVRRNLQKLLNMPDKLTAEFTEDWLMQFKPWRALVAAYLWQLESMSGY